MGSQSSEVLVKLPEFAPQGLATTAWAYSAFNKKDRTLLDAISKEVMQRLYEIEPQSLGILADAQLGCQPQLEQALRPFAQRFADLMPRGLDDSTMTTFMQLVREIRVDNFGAWGTRHVFQQMGLASPTQDFLDRAQGEILQAGAAVGADEGDARQGVLSGAALVHRRVFSYGEYEFEVRGSQGRALTGAMVKENGRRDRSFDPRSSMLKPLTSPISGLVDRSLCSEFQLLAIALDAAQGAAGAQRVASSITGCVRLFVSTSPCVSCLWVLRQCQIYMPEVKIEVANGEEAYIFSSSEI